MRSTPLLKIVSALLISSLTATTVYPASTKSKKNGSGNQSSSGGDQSGSGDGSDDSSGGKKDKNGDMDSSKSDGSSKSDTSKTGFDDGTYAESTAITYKAMQSVAAGIAERGKSVVASAKTVIVFDPVTFANIAQYRITSPQVTLLASSMCKTLTAMDREIYNETQTKNHGQPPGAELVQPKSGAGTELPGLSPAGQIVDLAQKVLTIMQTTTTIAGASVNVTDETLVAEVAASTLTKNPGVHVYYPGEFLLPDVDDDDISAAITNPFCTPGNPHHIVAGVIRLGVDRQEAASRNELLSAALDSYNSVVNPNGQKGETAPADQLRQTSPKKAKKPATTGVAPIPVPVADPDKKDHPNSQEKADALDKFFQETGFTNVDIATGYQHSLKSSMDAYDALLVSLATADSKEHTLFSRLVIAERLDSILKTPPDQDTKSSHTGSGQPADPVNKDSSTQAIAAVDIVIVKWLRAGALNKTRKNLFFLGQRNYYAGGATGLYEYFDGDQKMLASGTVTVTSQYVHDKDFDNEKKNKCIKMLDLTAQKTDPKACQK